MSWQAGMDGEAGGDDCKKIEKKAKEEEKRRNTLVMQSASLASIVHMAYITGIIVIAHMVVGAIGAVIIQVAIVLVVRKN